VTITWVQFGSAITASFPASLTGTVRRVTRNVKRWSSAKFNEGKYATVALLPPCAPPVEDVRVGFVEKDLFLDHRLPVSMKWNAGGVVGPGTFETAGLDHERVVAAVTVLVDPFADGKAGKLRIRHEGERPGDIGPTERHSEKEPQCRHGAVEPGVRSARYHEVPGNRCRLRNGRIALRRGFGRRHRHGGIYPPKVSRENDGLHHFGSPAGSA
jgi:hypothetical protein